MILCTEGAFRISIYCYDTAWTGHLKFCTGVVWGRIKTSKSGTPQKCMIATAGWDNIKGQAFTSEVVRRTENDFQCDGAARVSFYDEYCSPLRVAVVGLILEGSMSILQTVSW